MFSWYKYLIVSLVFSHPGFSSGNLFLIAPFPDLCLLVPFWFQQKRPRKVVVICRLHYINTLKQELDGTRFYQETGCDETSVVMLKNYLLSFLFASMKTKTNFLRFIGYLSFTKDRIKIKLRSFKSSEHINEKGDASYHGFDY